MAKTKYIVSSELVGQVYIPVEGVGTISAGYVLFLDEDQLHDQALQSAISAGMILQASKIKVLKKQVSQVKVQKKQGRADILDTDRPEMTLDLENDQDADSVDFIPLDSTKQNKNTAKSMSWDMNSSTALTPEQSERQALTQNRSIPMEVQTSKDGEVSFEDGMPETKIIDSEFKSEKKGKSGRGKNKSVADNILSDILSDLQ